MTAVRTRKAWAIAAFALGVMAVLHLSREYLYRGVDSTISPVVHYGHYVLGAICVVLITRAWATGSGGGGDRRFVRLGVVLVLIGPALSPIVDIVRQNARTPMLDPLLFVGPVLFCIGAVVLALELTRADAVARYRSVVLGAVAVMVICVLAGLVAYAPLFLYPIGFIADIATVLFGAALMVLAGVALLIWQVPQQRIELTSALDSEPLASPIVR